MFIFTSIFLILNYYIILVLFLWKIQKYSFLFFYFLAINFFSQKINYKINAGLNLSNFKYSATNMNSTSSNTNDNRVSYFFGLGFEKPLNITNNYSFLIDAELQYSQQGNSFDDSIIGRIYDINNQINLLLTLKSETLSNIYFGIGSYLGYIVFVDEYYRDDEENHNNFDFGLVGSLEYRFFKKMSIDIRYLYGLSDILDREFNNGTITHDKYNRVIQIALNYRFW